MLRMMCLMTALVLCGCASEWKIHGGPQECVQMCKSWNMELTGMVGVGNQDATGPGATACVCEVRTSGGDAPAAEAPEGPVAASGTAASTAAVVVALQEAERQRELAQQQQARPVPQTF